MSVSTNRRTPVRSSSRVTSVTRAIHKVPVDSDANDLHGDKADSTDTEVDLTGHSEHDATWLTGKDADADSRASSPSLSALTQSKSENQIVDSGPSTTRSLSKSSSAPHIVSRSSGGDAAKTEQGSGLTLVETSSSKGKLDALMRRVLRTGSRSEQQVVVAPDMSAKAVDKSDDEKEDEEDDESNTYTATPTPNPRCQRRFSYQGPKHTSAATRGISPPQLGQSNEVSDAPASTVDGGSGGAAAPDADSKRLQTTKDRVQRRRLMQRSWSVSDTQAALQHKDIMLQHDDQGVTGGTEAIQVLVRCRPFLPNELREPPKEEKLRGAISGDEGHPELCGVVGVNKTLKHVKVLGPRGTVREFRFSNVFGADSTQAEVFKGVQGVVENCLHGINATLLAYGQTTSGKTYTMMGTGVSPTRADSEELKGNKENAQEKHMGLMQRIGAFLFTNIRAEEKKNAALRGGNGAAVRYKVYFSEMEIYNEKIRDLLNCASWSSGDGAGTPRNRSSGGFGLSMRQTEDSFVVPDLSSHLVEDERHFSELLVSAARARETDAMRSSRSHAMCVITVEKGFVRESSDSMSGIVRSKLNIVDLAGCERFDESAGAKKQKETRAINLSLTTLSLVIQSLSKGSSHVPYRDSTLTKLLKDSLGGTARTLMVACVNPAPANAGVTLSTLRYASLTQTIKNLPKVNHSDPRDAQLAKLYQEVRRLRAELDRVKTKGGSTVGSSGSDESKSDGNAVGTSNDNNDDSSSDNSTSSTDANHAVEESSGDHSGSSLSDAAASSGQPGAQEAKLKSLLKQYKEITARDITADADSTEDMKLQLERAEKRAAAAEEAAHQKDAKIWALVNEIDRIDALDRADEEATLKAKDKKNLESCVTCTLQ